MKYLFIDVETGGLNPEKHSLLTASFMTVGRIRSFPEMQEEADSLDLFLKPDVGGIVATETALKINGIDLCEHEREATPYLEGLVRLREYLRSHEPIGGAREYLPVGFNVGFDLSFLFHHLIPESTWHQYVSYQALDLRGISTFIHHARGITCRSNLDDVAAFYGLARAPGPHTSHGDVRLARDLFLQLRESIR